MRSKNTMRIRWRNECLLDARQDNEIYEGIGRGVKAFCEFDDTQNSPKNEKRELLIYTHIANFHERSVRSCPRSLLLRMLPTNVL